ncbi:WYL domain-containing protein [Paenibacillus bouchesdurhonensis]|uniref:WYL domain-containing protein n=1 Tax=Paenibacillus bouchesdurhonensis TaxID=1870990 RepID=UPI000DA6273D|nr:WYL domain-containing protein [Paenibacillus bouchesdurhonensis]
MHLFEKIFNYQVISRLEDSGIFMVTSQERAWLKTMLQHPAAAEAFTAGTREKLNALLEQDACVEFSEHLIHKARSLEKQVYHPLLRTFRQYITQRSGFRISYELKNGRTRTEHSGFPYKLEYSMVKREWYLLWYHHRQRALMSTRLSKIVTVSAETIKPSDAECILEKIQQVLESRKSEAVIQIVREYNSELSRILYAFSCFEKDVHYDADTDTYHVRVCVLGDEVEYLLSKIRFLGKRVLVVEGDYLKKRMLESSANALERYGIVAAKEELSS